MTTCSVRRSKLRLLIDDTSILNPSPTLCKSISFLILSIHIFFHPNFLELIIFVSFQSQFRLLRFHYHAGISVPQFRIRIICVILPNSAATLYFRHIQSNIFIKQVSNNRPGKQIDKPC